MKKYEDINNDSEVESYEYGDNYFNVLLKLGKEVKYENIAIEGQFSLNKLRHLAESGKGLDNYMKELELMVDES